MAGTGWIETDLGEMGCLSEAAKRYFETGDVLPGFEVVLFDSGAENLSALPIGACRRLPDGRLIGAVGDVGAVMAPRPW